MIINPEQLKKQLGEKTTILKVDVDKNQQTATAYQVQGVPTFIIFKEGKIMWRQSGVISLEELKMQLQKFE
jgi:thioredoxin 1